MLEEGYDSDMQMGPFVQKGVEDEVFVDMDEEALKEHPTFLVPGSDAQNLEDFSPVTLTNKQIDRMKVTGVRKELKKRGMFVNGLKNVLIERLKEAIKNNIQLLEDRPAEEVANLAGDGFDGNSY